MSPSRAEPAPAAELELRADGEGTLLRLKVSAGAAKTRVIGVYGGALKVSVQAAPERGKANAAVRGLLAKALGIAASQVAIVKGETSPDKVAWVALPPDELRARW